MRISDWSSDVCSSDLTNRYIAFMEKLAVGYNINIVGGSHPTRDEGGDLRNIAYVFLPDGSVHHQAKLHPPPSERRWWTLTGRSEERRVGQEVVGKGGSGGELYN